MKQHGAALALVLAALSPFAVAQDSPERRPCRSPMRLQIALSSQSHARSTNG
jgi:hypothetical protein